MVDAFAEMHHLVSRGYQQNFADAHRVAVLAAGSGEIIDRARAIKSNFVRPGYNTRIDSTGDPDSRLEREFAKLERPILDQIRRVTPTNCGRDLCAAVVTLFAVHLVRSEAFQRAHSEVVEQLRQDWLPQVATEPEARRRFEADYGEAPTDKDIIRIGERILEENVRANRFHVDGMVRLYNKIANQLGKFYVQVITSDRLEIGFALGDVPVVHANTRTGQYGFRDRLAIGDADLIIGPLTRFTAVALSVNARGPVKLTVKRRLQELNAVFARAALGEIACHPGDAHEVQRVCANLDRFAPDRLVRR